MLIPRAVLAPHVPTLLVDEHRGHRTPMIEALASLAAGLEADHAEAIVLASARWESDGPFQVDTGRRHRTLTDYSGFGVEVRYDCPGHPALARALVAAGERAGVHVGPAQRGVDSGATVPLHFLFPRPGVPVVPLSIARRPPADGRAWGAVVRRALEARRERCLFVVGGLLSFSEHDWSLRREVPESREFDEHVLRVLASGAWNDLHACGRRIRERAKPEGGLLHLEMLRGFLGADLGGQVRCYESGPGVGAALVEFEIPAVGA